MGAKCCFAHGEHELKGPGGRSRDSEDAEDTLDEFMAGIDQDLGRERRRTPVQVGHRLPLQQPPVLKAPRFLPVADTDLQSRFRRRRGERPRRLIRCSGRVFRGHSIICRTGLPPDASERHCHRSVVDAFLYANFLT